ncbi:hypothetical protein [Spiroplasma alleghenense]|uniref:DUF3137 domain-containing protein n=1 Tax=Spiroplasma alleghenense TaxID=216931 RepID=A0A345Z3R1_9MOLU|nr:hypothetical protein [Spiroplasma alleghenense]AXK51240.1 hypothetical protein SALLE_v1c05680 [Spiroplasma alleghenense]
MESNLEQKYQKLLTNSVNSFYSETVNFEKSKWSTKLIYYGMSLIAVAFIYFYVSSILYQEFDKAFKDIKNGQSLKIFCMYILPFLIFVLGAILAIISFFKRRELENNFEYFEDWEYLYDLRSKIIIDINMQLLSLDDQVPLIEDNFDFIPLVGTSDFYINQALNFQFDKNLISYADIYFPNNKNNFTTLKFYGLEIIDEKYWFENEITLEITETMQERFLKNDLNQYLFEKTGFDKNDIEESQQVEKIIKILNFKSWLGKVDLEEFSELTIKIFEKKICFCFNFKVNEEIFNYQSLDFIKKDASKTIFKNALASKIDFELIKVKKLTQIAYKILGKTKKTINEN